MKKIEKLERKHFLLSGYNENGDRFYVNEPSPHDSLIIDKLNELIDVVNFLVDNRKT